MFMTILQAQPQWQAEETQLHPLALIVGVVGFLALMLIVLGSSFQKDRLQYIARRALRQKQMSFKKDEIDTARAGKLPTFAKTAAETGDLRMLKRWTQSINKNMDARSDENLTALHYAARGGYNEAVRLLLENGADPNCFDERRLTPLHLAAVGGFGLSVKMLLDKNADPFSEDLDLQTPLKLAQDSGNIGCSRLLQRAMAKATQIEQEGGLALRTGSERRPSSNNV